MSNIERQRLAELLGTLRELADDAELQAAHSREFIPDSQSAPSEVRHALNAVAHSGVAIGIRVAVDLLGDALGDVALNS